MLHSVEFLCSVVAFAGLVHVLSKALMSLCSPRSALQVVTAGIPPARVIRKVRPVMAVAVSELVDDEKQPPCSNDLLQLLAAPTPPVLVLPAFKVGNKFAEGRAAARRPSRLVIPPPVARAGINPFGDVACREVDVVAEVEAQGEGFCVASRRGVRHAMEDAYGVITDKIGGDSRLVNTISSLYYLQINSLQIKLKINYPEPN